MAPSGRSIASKCWLRRGRDHTIRVGVPMLRASASRSGSSSSSKSMGVLARMLSLGGTGRAGASGALDGYGSEANAVCP